MHNDTWNVWTHFFGVVLFGTLLVHVCSMGAPAQIGETLGERLSTQLGQLRGALSTSVSGAAGSEHGVDLAALAARLMTPTELQAAWGRVPSLSPWQLAEHPAIAALFALPFAQSACRTPPGVNFWHEADRPGQRTRGHVDVPIGTGVEAGAVNGGSKSEGSAEGSAEESARLLSALSADLGPVRHALLQRIDCLYLEL